MDIMKELSLQKFAEELASSSPAPGGGAVAALCSSIAASLSSMVFNLSIDKKFYNDYEEAIKEKIVAARDKCQQKKDEFLNWMDEDTEVFNSVMAAFKLPKETEEEKELRSKKIQSSYIAAMQVPLKVAGEAGEIFDALKLAAEYGNPNAVSDAGVGALLALAAVEAAILNVKINLGSIKDSELVASVARQCEEITLKASKNKAEVMEIVNKKIN